MTGTTREEYRPSSKAGLYLRRFSFLLPDVCHIAEYDWLKVTDALKQGVRGQDILPVFLFFISFYSLGSLES